MYRQIQIGRDIDRYIEVEREGAFLRWTITESLQIIGAILTIDRNGDIYLCQHQYKIQVASGVQGYSFIQ